MAKKKPQHSPTILVSSTVYHIEELLDKIFGVLQGFGYTVWMSHRGTVPVDPAKSNFENCLAAVENCDLFLGIITPFYGTGRDGDQNSITHQEILRAIEIDKPRWFLAHDHVVFARQLFKQYRFNNGGNPVNFEFKKTEVMDDLRVIEMYEAAIRAYVNLADREGNWVQSYSRFDDVVEYVSAQFNDINRIRQLIREQKKL